MKVLHLLVILVLLLWAYDGSPYQCSPRCSCFLNDENDLTARCKVRNADHNPIILPEFVRILDLSGSDLTEVPSLAFLHLRNITGLFLANNKISRIKANSFKYLPSLELIDLSNNTVTKWDVAQMTELGHLRIVDFSGTAFIPDQRFLRLPKLEIIIGVTWRSECKDCLIARTDAVKESFGQSHGFCAIEETGFDYREKIDYGMSIFFAKNGFSPQCLCSDKKCENAEVGKPYTMELNLIIRRLFYVEYVLGPLAIVLNLVVLLTIGTSWTLHKPAFLLICNIAVCDLWMGLYTVLIGRYTIYEFITNEQSYGGMDTKVNMYCSVMGFIFTTSQVVVTLTSLLATLERYFSIVFCMDPSKRLRKKTTIALILLIWACGICYAILPLFRVGGLRYHGEFTCMLPFVDGPEESNVSVSTLVIAVLLSLVYVFGIVLYLPLYKSVKKSNLNADVRRNAALAKNIAVMISTNFVFSLMPLISTLLFVYCHQKCMAMWKIDSLKELQIYFICLSWLPVVLLSINSCLNPFLCAFRNPKIKQRVSVFFKRVKNLLCREDISNPGGHWTSASVEGIELAATSNRILTIGIQNLASSEHFNASM